MIVQSVLFVSSSISASVSPNSIDALDRAVRLDLLHTSDLFFVGVWTSAIVVAIGCALEGPEIFHEIFPKLFSWFTWKSESHLQRFERRVKIAGLIGWLFVVFGVAAEGVLESLDHHASGLVQTFDETLLSDTQRKAGSAADAAERANTAADEAQAKIDAVGRKSANLTAELAKQQSRADAIDGLLARDMGIVRRNVDAMGRRSVTTSLDEINRNPSRSERFNAVREFSRITVLIRIQPGNADPSSVEEIKRLSEEISTLLKEAGWFPDFNLSWIPGGGPEKYPTGVWIARSASPPTSRTARASHALASLLELDLNGVGEITDSPNPAFPRIRWMFGSDVPPNALMIGIGANPRGNPASWPDDFAAPPNTKQTDSNTKAKP